MCPGQGWGGGADPPPLTRNNYYGSKTSPPVKMCSGGVWKYLQEARISWTPRSRWWKPVFVCFPEDIWPHVDSISGRYVKILGIAGSYWAVLGYGMTISNLVVANNIHVFLDLSGSIWDVPRLSDYGYPFYNFGSLQANFFAKASSDFFRLASVSYFCKTKVSV